MVGEAIERTLQVMEISNRGLARLLKIDVHTITDNRDKNWGDLTPTTFKKLGAVTNLVVKEFSLYKPAIILEILNLHVFKDADGKKYSVLTALNSDKFDFEAVVAIGNLAQQAYREKILKSAPSVPPLPDAISA